MTRRVVIVLSALIALAAPASAAVKPAPSLTPAATLKLWRAEVARAKTRPRVLADTACRPARVLFYAQTDWLRLATKLAAQPSPCAQYYISVPPLAADKSQARPNQAAQIRALGASFHALDEISWNGWSAWVSSNGATWFDAGVTARQRMAAAGFDAAAGDTWALNELSSAVRAGTGAARQNALEFLRGLSSDGVKGAVFVAGVGQTTADTSTYKVNLQNWLQDTPFWSAASQYASDWAQENYGDLRAYAVAGSTAQQRRDAEAQYLGHELALATAGPDGAATARTYLRASYVAFGNAAWAWSSAYGWTAAPLDSMQDFVSGQVYGARSLGAPSGVDRLGFAWSPNNTLGLSTGDFDSQTASVLDRIAAAIRDSGAPSADPGDAACAPAWCTTSIDGAAFTSAWPGFAMWSQTAPVFLSAPVATQQGTAAPLSLQLQTLGLADTGAVQRTLTFTSSSATGGFSTSAEGPWTPSLTIAVPTGTSDVAAYYLDSAPGTPTLTVSLSGGGSAAQPATIAAVPSAGASAPPPQPPAQPTPSAPAVPPTPQAPVVVAPRPRVTSVRTHYAAGHVTVSVVVAADGKRVRGARVLIRVRRGSREVARVVRVTTTNGVATWRSAHRLNRGRYVATAAVRSASTA